MTLTFHWYVVGKYDVYTALWQRNNRHNVSVPMMMPLELRLNTSNCVPKSGQRKRLMAWSKLYACISIDLKRIILISLVLSWIYFIINEWKYTNSKKSLFNGCCIGNISRFSLRNYSGVCTIITGVIIWWYESWDFINFSLFFVVLTSEINTNFETFESKWKFKILTFSVDF